MTKTFEKREPRLPKNITADPAHARAASEFSQEALEAAAAAAKTPAPTQPALEPAPPAPRPAALEAPPVPKAVAPATRRHARAVAKRVIRRGRLVRGARKKKPVEPVQKAELGVKPLPAQPGTTASTGLKQHAFPSAAARQRLRSIRRYYKKAESFVGQLAIATYFAAFDDGVIAGRIRAHGHGIKRAPDAGQRPPLLTIGITEEQRDRFDTLYFDHQVARSYVAGDAIEWLLAHHSDEQIVNALSEKGLGLRRPRGATA